MVEAGEASMGCRNCGTALAGTQRFCGACGFAFAAAQFYRGNVFFIVLRAILVAVLSWATTLATIFGFIVLFAHIASP